MHEKDVCINERIKSVFDLAHAIYPSPEGIGEDSYRRLYELSFSADYTAVKVEVKFPAFGPDAIRMREALVATGNTFCGALDALRTNLLREAASRADTLLNLTRASE